jgi:hypothetical protein
MIINPMGGSVPLSAHIDFHADKRAVCGAGRGKLFSPQAVGAGESGK